MEVLARLNRENGKEQSLSAHSRTVAEMCGESCGQIGLASLGRLIGLLHDIGKGSEAFQRYLRSGDLFQRGKIPHSYCGARYCCERFGLDGSVAGLTAQLAAAAVCAHHSGLPDVTGPDARDGLATRLHPHAEADYEQVLSRCLGPVFNEEEFQALFEKARQEVSAFGDTLRRACDKLPAESKNSVMYFFFGLTQRFLLSSLIDADRYDAYLFESEEKPPAEPDLPKLWKELSARLEKHLAAYPCRSDIDRNRRAISQSCLAFASNGQGIYRLSVPTGSGKTMSSLRYALNCAAGTGKKRIFYIAPYRSVLEQNAGDIRDALRNGADPDLAERVILEHHSDVVPEDDLGGEEVKRHSLLTQRWEGVEIVLTTTVQFLNALFRGKSACVRRMHSLADSVIILDEVQAVPAQCTYLLNAALNFLSCACGCSVVLCTATQPESDRLAVPVIPASPSQMTKNLDETFAAFCRTRVVDFTREGEFSAGRLAGFALERLDSCDNVLVILNTKSAAAALYSALCGRMEETPTERRVPVFFLSTALCPQHRIDLIGKIRERLSTPSAAASRMICVSTQLIEAGVNLSFQCVIRSLAGLDSIAQAAGRCNRHGEAETRDVFVIRSGDEVLSSLPDIRKAQDASAHVLDDFASNPVEFASDLLSPPAMKRYYSYYYHQQMSQLAYPVSPKNHPKLYKETTLFDLLSVNSLARDYCRENNGAAMPPHPLHQAFETAGEAFTAIEEKGMEVLVAYGEGEALIAALGSGENLKEQKALLRRAQRFTVQLFDTEKRRLEELKAVHFLPDLGIAWMDKRFYHPELGVQTAPNPMEPLIS